MEETVYRYTHKIERCELCGEIKIKVECALGNYYECEICDSIAHKVVHAYETNGETRH